MEDVKVLDSLYDPVNELEVGEYMLYYPLDRKQANAIRTSVHRVARDAGKGVSAIIRVEDENGLIPGQEHYNQATARNVVRVKRVK